MEILDEKFEMSPAKRHLVEIRLMRLELFDKEAEEVEVEVWEYAIIPISFYDYNEYADRLNDYGSDGWEFGAMIRAYENSPVIGKTTHDFICKRKKR